MASLASSIGLTSSLNRAEERATPSFPLEFTTTELPVTATFIDASDKCAILCPLLADANLIGLARHAENSSTNDNIVAAASEICTGSIAHRYVEAASGVAKERIDAIRRVAIASCIV